jgi:chromosome segregation ATPase
LTSEQPETQGGFGTGLRRALEQRQEPIAGERQVTASNDPVEAPEHLTMQDPPAVHVVLDERMVELATREESLRSLEAQLRSQRDRLEQREQRLASIEDSLSDRIREIVQREAEIEAREADLKLREQRLAAQRNGQLLDAV